ncbi:hypothetical protein [Anaerobiospirillum sp. NML120511]|uniref:hypothetical protein n=1 Tax=Anaerobiospirillum sp. NML120511 TaxID=2932819 RepID=UPI001FF47E7D|nr:hypothetical protein [Anaerobiospirillum sp. NML120511]MCK0535088.1 hypothetical protein [Anaerobiospirillum sp. NML120511]
MPGLARLGWDFCSGGLPSKLRIKPGRKLRRKWRDLQRKQPETAVCAGVEIWPVIKVKWYITCIGKIIMRGFWLEYEPHLQVNNDLASISAA